MCGLNNSLAVSKLARLGVQDNVKSLVFGIHSLYLTWFSCEGNRRSRMQWRSFWFLTASLEVYLWLLCTLRTIKVPIYLVDSLVFRGFWTYTWSSTFWCNFMWCFCPKPLFIGLLGPLLPMREWREGNLRGLLGISRRRSHPAALRLGRVSWRQGWHGWFHDAVDPGSESQGNSENVLVSITFGIFLWHGK